jgi:hypothetical protein
LIKEANGKQFRLLLHRIYSDLLSYCNELYFPITDQVILPLIELCCDNQDEDEKSRMESLQLIFKVYSLYKSYRGKINSIFKNYEYFEPEIFVRFHNLLKELHADRYWQILNEDILLNKNTSKQYLRAVKVQQTESIALLKDDAELKMTPVDIHFYNQIRSLILNHL